MTNLGGVTGSGPVNNTVLWSVDTEDAVLSSPVVVDGWLFVGTMGGKVLCLNAYSGSNRWTFQADGPVESSPAFVDGKVYVGSDDGNMYCLDNYGGNLIWNTSTGGEIKSSPVVAKGRVYFGSNDFSVYCLNAGTGEVLWTFPTGGYVYSSPALYEDAIFFGSCDGKIYCVNTTSGEEVWAFQAEYAPASPAVTDELVIVGAYDDHLWYLNRTTGEEVWNVSGMEGGIYSSAAVWEGNDGDLPVVFVADNAGTMYFIDQDGEIRGSWEGNGGITASPILALDFKEGPLTGPLLVFADDGGTLYGREVLWPSDIMPAVWDPDVRWNITLGTSIKSSPFLYHERVYVGAERDGGGSVVCIGPPTPQGEVWFEFWEDPFPRKDYIDVWVRVHGVPVEDLIVEVVYEGERVQADYDTRGNSWWLASFEARPPEGEKDVIVWALVDGMIVGEETWNTWVMITGWSSLDVTIDKPLNNSYVGDVVRVSGTATTNYTITNFYVKVDEASDKVWYILESGEFDGHSWSITIDTQGLEPGEHTLWVACFDEHRHTYEKVIIHVCEEGEAEPVVLLEVGVLILLIIIFVYLLRTKPPRVSEDPSKR